MQVVKCPRCGQRLFDLSETTRSDLRIEIKCNKCRYCIVFAQDTNGTLSPIRIHRAVRTA